MDCIVHGGHKELDMTEWPSLSLSLKLETVRFLNFSWTEKWVSFAFPWLQVIADGFYRSALQPTFLSWVPSYTLCPFLLHVPAAVFPFWFVEVFIYFACSAQLFSHVWLFLALWTAARHTPLPMEFSSKNIEAGCCFLLQDIFPTCRWKPCLLSLLHWQVDFLPLAPPGKPLFWLLVIYSGRCLLADAVEMSAPAYDLSDILWWFLDA